MIFYQFRFKIIIKDTWCSSSKMLLFSRCLLFSKLADTHSISVLLVINHNFNLKLYENCVLPVQIFYRHWYNRDRFNHCTVHSDFKVTNFKREAEILQFVSAKVALFRIWFSILFEHMTSGSTSIQVYTVVRYRLVRQQRCFSRDFSIYSCMTLWCVQGITFNEKREQRTPYFLK